MDKSRSRIPEPSPSLEGPDYVALVIEWDEIADTLEETRLSQLQMRDETSAWTRVDEASDESFPASDPPAWGSSHAVAEPAAPQDEPDEVTAPMSGLHARRNKMAEYARRIALGVVALGALLTFVEHMRRIRPEPRVRAS